VLEQNAPQCPHCRKRCFEFTSIYAGPAPNVGDFSVCGHCGELSRFTADKRLEAVSVSTAMAILQPWQFEDLMRARDLVRSFHCLGVDA